MRDVQGRMSGMEIKLHGKNSKKEKNGEGRPRTHSGPSGQEKKNPKSK
jgi:hypothetical protein